MPSEQPLVCHCQPVQVLFFVDLHKEGICEEFSLNLELVMNNDDRSFAFIKMLL